MTRRLLTLLVLVSLFGAGVQLVAQAQTFKVEKFDIKGDGGTDYVDRRSRRPAACSCRAPRT